MKLRNLLLLASGVAAASQVSALSIGNTQGSVQLGSPVDLVFQFQPDPGQTVESSCITADVWMGDTALSNNDVSLTPQTNAFRLRTTSPAYEPLMTIKLRAGCASSVTRSYTFFADPPQALTASPVPIDLSKIQVSTLAPTPTASVTKPPATNKPARKPRPAKRATAKPVVQAAAPAAAAALTSEAPTAPAPDPSTAPTATAASSATDEKPRLRVEPIEGLDTPTGTAAPIDTDSAALPPDSTIDPQTQLVLDANAERLAAMEKQLQALQTQLTNNRTEITSLQTQLVQAQNQGLPVWVHIMLGMLALALATIAWLIQRIKQERQNAQATTWADTVLAAEDSGRATTVDTRAISPTPAASLATNTAAASAKTVAATASTAAAPATPAYPTASGSQLAAASSATLMPEELYAELDDSAPSAAGHSAQQPQPSIADVLTAQALFDVQEQAEFYASIGENDQAIEILQTHLAEHETSSPLAYIELLQLLYRLSRTEAFNQVREKFHAHFNVKVPDFLSFSRKGQDLWSGYPEVLGQVEALWPTDEVQALLRNLIVREPGSASADNLVRFDLSAFDDLLMLYNVAQTTPATSRGQLPGRMRTAPAEAALPSVEESATLALHKAHLDMLSAAPAAAPLASPMQDSPFHSPQRFAPSEALVDDLSLEWDAAAASAPTTTPPQPTSDSLAKASPNDELAAFMMDERDLPSFKKKS